MLWLRKLRTVLLYLSSSLHHTLASQDGRHIPSQHRASGSRETLAVAIADWGLGQGRGRGIRGGERGCEGLFRVSEGPWITARDLVLALRETQHHRQQYSTARISLRLSRGGNEHPSP